MSKRHWLLSLLTCAGLGSISVPVSGQALLPYAPQLNSQQLEEQGLKLAQDAIQLYQFQQDEIALPRAKLATQLAPGHFQTWFILGSLYVRQEEFNQGIEALNKALALAPEETGIFFSLGDAYFRNENYLAAVESLKAGLKLNPESPEALFNLGNAYLMLNQNSEAIAAYEQAFTLNQEFWPAINNVGLIKYEQGAVEEAIQHWQTAISVDNSQAEPRLAAAVALYAQGKQEEGLRLGESAIALDSRYADAEFLKENLWGDRLVLDTQAFLATPQMQAVLARFQEELPEIESPGSLE